MNIQTNILNFINNEDNTSILDFINIVKKYYYNNDFPNTNEQNKLKYWFGLKNLNEIKYFLSNVSDEEYDYIIEFLKINNIQINTEIGSVPYHKKCNLPVFVGSLDKIKNETEYLNWKKKINNETVLITEKLDGISALLCIDKKKEKIISNLYTRGNGKIGCDISHLIKYFLEFTF